MTNKNRYFAVRILTKPYLKKYLQALYGDPVIFTSKNPFGTLLMALLERPPVPAVSKEKLRLRIDEFSSVLEIFCPLWFLQNNKYGFDIKDSHVIALNKYFEQRFTEDLFKFCHLLNICGVSIEDAIEEFCKNHQLEMDVDVTFEGMKQKEYRYRMHLKDINAGAVKTQKPIQISIF